MASPHVTSEELAQVALEADVPQEVTDHLATCAQCRADLATLTALLNADGPDGPEARRSSKSTDDVLADAALAANAMADGNDSTPAADEESQLTEAQKRERAAKLLAPTEQGMQKRTLFIILIVLAGALLISLLALR